MIKKHRHARDVQWVECLKMFFERAWPFSKDLFVTNYETESLVQCRTFKCKYRFILLNYHKFKSLSLYDVDYNFFLFFIFNVSVHMYISFDFYMSIFGLIFFRSLIIYLFWLKFFDYDTMLNCHWSKKLK